MNNRVDVVITGEGKRRHSNEFKERLVRLATAPSANLSQIARQNGITPSLLFKWKKDHIELENPTPQPDPLNAPGFARILPPESPPEVNREIYIHCGDDVVIELSESIDPRRLALLVKAVRAAACAP